ncbi:MAG: hypothetical protein WC866_04855 [Patescibacteria group bacterium]|jgi:hypothetical protein
MSELAQNRLLHLAAACGVVRQVVDHLRHGYTPDFHTAHLAAPVFDDVREYATWYASGFPRDVISKLGHAKVSKLVLAGDFDAVRVAVCANLHCEDSGCHEAHEMTTELRGLTEDERLELVDHNQKMYLAVTVGYIRCTLARVCDRRDDYECARGHLEHPVFAALPKPVLSRIELEICEYWKDGMLNGARTMMDAALSRDHNFFWSMANRAVGCGVPVEPMPINPELLPEDLFPAPEIIMKKKENVLLHLALAVGYARLSRKSVEDVDTVMALTFAQAHLELEAFRDLSAALRKIVVDEIHMLAHDGNGTPDQGVELIEAAVAGKYGPCWKLANYRLHQREPSHRPVLAAAIDPAWLL